MRAFEKLTKTLHRLTKIINKKRRIAQCPIGTRFMFISGSRSTVYVLTSRAGKGMAMSFSGADSTHEQEIRTIAISDSAFAKMEVIIIN